MHIEELLLLGSKVAITVTPADLKEFALLLIDETLAARNQETDPETYLTPDDVAIELGVSKNTLWRWDKIDYLSPVKVGRKSLYRKSDIDFLRSGKKNK